MTRPGRGRLWVADMFCGAGGLSEGFRAAGFGILAGSDSDPDACATYARNFPEATTVYGDIRTPPVREQFLAAAAAADVLVGGPPCQGFSQVRNHARLGDDPRNSLYREFVAAIGTIRPTVFVMENVLGMAEMGVRDQVTEDLSLDGEYEVTAQVHNAADFGVPQTRRRLVFTGVRAGSGIALPATGGTGVTKVLRLQRREGGGLVRYEPTTVEDSLAAARLLGRLADPDDPGVVSAAQALGDLCAFTAGTARDEIEDGALPPPTTAYQRIMRQDHPSAVVANTSVPRINPDTVLRLAGIPEGGNHVDLPDDLRDRYLTGNRWGPDNGTGRLGRRHYYAYRRLHPAMWSWTLNTKADSVYHYSALRALSVREFARLQSFPDDFVFTTDHRRGDPPGTHRRRTRPLPLPPSRQRRPAPPRPGRRHHHRRCADRQEAPQRVTPGDPDRPFGAANRAALLAGYFTAAGPVTPENAWEQVYRLLLWADATTGLAHCYESDKAQPGRPWYARTLAFHAWLAQALGTPRRPPRRDRLAVPPSH